MFSISHSYCKPSESLFALARGLMEDQVEHKVNFSSPLSDVGQKECSLLKLQGLAAQSDVTVISPRAQSDTRIISQESDGFPYIGQF